MIHYGLLVIIAFCHGIIFGKVDPLEKISVKSVRAFTAPLKSDPNFHLVRYEQDVRVVLADNTCLTGDVLEVIVSRKAASAAMQHTVKESVQNKTKKDQQVKSVVLKGNVKITRVNHIVRADKAELLVEKKQCLAQGNVHITQKRMNLTDIPVKIDSERAVLDLSTQKLLLVGSEKSPVSTVFELKALPTVKTIVAVQEKISA